MCNGQFPPRPPAAEADITESPGNTALLGPPCRNSGGWTCVWSLRRTVLVPAKIIGTRAWCRWDELIGGIVKERKGFCWYRCSRSPDLLLGESGFADRHERQDQKRVERASVHCCYPRSSGRIVRAQPLFLGAARGRLGERPNWLS